MNTESVLPTPYLRLLEARAPTLSGRSAIRYAVLADPERSQVSLTIVANEGGGNWNREVIALSVIEAALGDRPAGEPFGAKALKGAISGKSSNNAGFLAAALVHAGLLAPAPETKHALIKAGDWPAWQTVMLTREGEAMCFPPHAADAAPNAVTAVEPPPANEKPGRTTRRRGSRHETHAEEHDEDGGHVDHS